MTRKQSHSSTTAATTAEPISLYDVLAAAPSPVTPRGETNLTKKTETVDETESLHDDPSLT